MAEATKTSLKASNDLLKADNTKMEKRLKELEKLEKIADQADRCRNSVFEYFQNKYEDLDEKTRPNTFTEFMPKSLQKYFTKTELEY